MIKCTVMLGFHRAAEQRNIWLGRLKQTVAQFHFRWHTECAHIKSIFLQRLQLAPHVHARTKTSSVFALSLCSSHLVRGTKQEKKHRESGWLHNSLTALLYLPHGHEGPPSGSKVKYTPATRCQTHVAREVAARPVTLSLRLSVFCRCSVCWGVDSQRISLRYTNAHSGAGKGCTSLTRYFKSERGAEDFAAGFGEKEEFWTYKELLNADRRFLQFVPQLYISEVRWGSRDTSLCRIYWTALVLPQCV